MSTDQTAPAPAGASVAAVPGAADATPAAGSQPTAGSATSAGPQAVEPRVAGGAAVDGAAVDGVVAASGVSDPVARSRQAEASGELVAMSFPGARRIAGWLFWVVFPLLCVGAVYTSVNNVVHHLGKKPTGIRGTFVVQPRSCSQGFCSFGGLFTSDDHAIRNLPLLGDPRWHTADVHRVTYDPKSVEVTALPGHWDPTASVVAALGALTYLVVIGDLGRRQRREPNRPRRVAQPA